MHWRNFAITGLWAGFLALLLVSAANAQLIQSVAGNGANGYSGDGGAANQSVLNNPYGLALDSQGNLFIADSNNCRIRVVNTGTSPITVAGVTIPPGNIATVAGNGIAGFSGDGGQATSAEIYNPSGVTVDKFENIYIDDLYNYRIRKVDPSGIITTVTGNGQSNYSGDGVAAEASLFPYSVTVDSTGNLYIADTYNNAIRVVNTGSFAITRAGVTIPPGNIATVAGTGQSGLSGDNGPALEAEFNDPYGVAVDANNNIYICDTYNRKIRVVNTGTAPITVASVAIQPGYVATVAGDGNYWFKFAGLALTAEFADPDAVAVDRLGNIYISDTENSSIHVVDHDSGLIITIAGDSLNYGYNGDNIPATTAYLSYPRALAVDVNGNVFIADQPNQRIREIMSASFTRSFTDSSSTMMVAGQPASFAVTTNYWPTPRLSAIGLPSGLLFTDNGDGTGLISGSPAVGTNGTYQVTLTAVDVFFSAVSQNLTLTILPPGSGPSTSSVTFVGIDTVTQGNWQGTYGGDGYVLAGASNPFVPAYASFSVLNPPGYICAPPPHTFDNVCIWFSPTVTGLYSEEPVTDPRALLLPGSNSTRLLATWENNASFSFDLNITDGKAHEFALYALDWDSKGRLETIEIDDAVSGFPLYSTSIDNFTVGSYLVWSISGHVRITITDIAGVSASISGAFFGGNSPTVPVITQEPQSVTTTVGSAGTFDLVATGGALSYQWWSQAPGASSFSPISGAMSNSYTVPIVRFSDGGTQFKCVVTNNLGTTVSQTVTLNILVPITIALTPGSPSILLGKTQSLVATATYPSGGTQDITSQVSWSSSNTGVATVDNFGVVTAISTGTATIYATELGVTGSTVVTVPTLSSITVSPQAPIIGVGQALQFTATGNYQGGVTLDLTSQVVWSSGTPSAATVSSSGVVTGVGTGSAIIGAQINGVSGNASVTVLVQPAGLVLYWSFDQSADVDGIAQDASGHNGNGTIAGNPKQVAGKLNQALSFNGTNTSVSMNAYADEATEFDTSMTLTAWINTTNASRLEGVISKYNAAGSGWGYLLRTNASGTAEVMLGWQDVNSASAVATDTTRINDGQWHHVVAVLTIGQGVTFYVDGVYSSSTAMNITSSGDNWTNLTVGVNPYTYFGNYFTGSIDEVRVYNRALSAAEVSTVYQISGGGPAATLNSITVTPANPSVLPGGTQGMTATGNYTGGGTQNLTSQVTWSSGTPGAATVNSAGVVTGVASGTSTISATLNGVTGSTVVTVPALTSITVTPASPTVNPGGTQGMTATGNYAGGGTQNLSSQVTWSSGTPGAATVNSAGVVTGVASGTSTISATLNGVTGSTVVTVSAPTSITVTPANPSVLPGGTQGMTATGNYAGGGTQNLTSQVTWSSGTPGAATVNSAGVVTGVASGTSTISATLNGVTGSTVVTVPALTSITVTPANPSINAGNTQGMTATGNYAGGGTQNLTSQVTWSSGTPGVATVTSAGTLTGVSAGTSLISATLNGVSGSTTATVVSGGPLTVIPTTLVNAKVGQPYSVQLIASGGAAPYRWVVVAGSLPPGLSLSSSGILSGTPSGPSYGVALGNSSPFYVYVVDANYNSVQPSTGFFITVTN